MGDARKAPRHATAINLGTFGAESTLAMFPKPCHAMTVNLAKLVAENRVAMTVQFGFRFILSLIFLWKVLLSF